MDTGKFIMLGINIDSALVLYKKKEYRKCLDVVCNLKSEGVSIEGVDLLRAKCLLDMNVSYKYSAAEQALLEELRLFPDSQNAKSMLEMVRRSGEVYGRELTSDMSEEFVCVLSVIRDFTMLPNARLWSLWQNVEIAMDRGDHGVIAEFGVAGGGSTAMLAYLVKKHGLDTRVLAFDSFMGMPAPGKLDMFDGLGAQERGWGEGTCRSGIESLQEVSERLGVWDKVCAVPGYFNDVLLDFDFKGEKILAIHVDCDWYESVKCVLDKVLPNCREGTYMQVDDYGYWDGVKVAVDQSLTGISFTISDIDGYSCGVVFNGER